MLEIRCTSFYNFPYSFIHFHLACHSMCLLLRTKCLLISSFYCKWCARGPARSSINFTNCSLLCITLVKLVNSNLLHLASAMYIRNGTVNNLIAVLEENIKRSQGKLYLNELNMSDHGDEPYEERPADDQEVNGDLGKRSRTLSRKGLQ